jgi:hypothetical protein
VSEGLPADRDGSCLPWFTFAAISFLKGRINPKFRIIRMRLCRHGVFSSGITAIVASTRKGINFSEFKDLRDSILKDLAPSTTTSGLHLPSIATKIVSKFDETLHRLYTSFPRFPPAADGKRRTVFKLVNG